MSSDESSSSPSSSSVSSSVSSSSSASSVEVKRGKGSAKGATKKAPAKAKGKATKGKKADKETKKRKDPNAPKKPLSAFMYFMSDIRPKLKAESPELTFGELGRKSGELWKSLDDAAKKPYEKKAAEDRVRYERERENYVPPKDSGRPTKKAKKDPNAPRRNLNAYMFFMNEFRETIKAAGGSLKPTEIGREGGEKWKSLSATEKKKYEDQAADDKARYEKEMLEYTSRRSFITSRTRFPARNFSYDQRPFNPSDRGKAPTPPLAPTPSNLPTGQFTNINSTHRTGDDVGHEHDINKAQGPLHTLSSMMESLTARYSEKMLAQLFRVFLACVVLIGAGLYIYGETISRLLGRQTAEVANITLQDETVQIKVGEFAKELLNQLIGHYSNDPETRQQAVAFLVALAADPGTVTALRGLVHSTLEDPSLQSHASASVQQILNHLVSTPEWRIWLNHTLMQLINDPATIELAVGLVKSILTDPTTQDQVERIVESLITSEKIQRQGEETARLIVSTLLADEKLAFQLRDLLERTASSPEVQEAVGYGLWEALTIAITPSLFRSRQHISEKSEDQLLPTSPAAESPVSSASEMTDAMLAEAELLLIEAFESATARLGTAYTPEMLLAKERVFDDELYRRQTKLPLPLRRHLVSLSAQLSPVLFKCERVLAEAGESALIQRARARLDVEVASILARIHDMPRLEKGWIWNGYTASQEAERQELQLKLAALERRRLLPEQLVVDELNLIQCPSPAAIVTAHQNGVLF